MKQRRSNLMPVVITALVLCPALYVGSYFALVGRNELARDTDAYWVKYRIGGYAAKSFFAPLHRVDRRIRRDYWEPPRYFEVELSAFGEEVKSLAPGDSK
jgi:hypothetical protein